MGKRLPLFGEIVVYKILVVTAGDKADLLRVRLLRRGQAMLAGKVTNLRLSHVPQGEHRPTELLLREPEKKIRLVLGMIRRTLEQPTAATVVELHAGIGPSRDRFRAELLCHSEELIKLQMIVAENARDRRAPGIIL